MTDRARELVAIWEHRDEAHRQWLRDGAVPDIQAARSALATLPPAVAPEVSALKKGILAVAGLISDSYGVDGLHLNGEVAPWSDSRTGGRFEEWLADFDVALALAGPPPVASPTLPTDLAIPQFLRRQTNAPAVAPEAMLLRRVRHSRRGTFYDVIGEAELQTSHDLFDGERMIVYRGDDGLLWTRPADEFEDGRFEDVPALVLAVSPPAIAPEAVALARFFMEMRPSSSSEKIDIAVQCGLMERDGMIRIELTDLGRAALALAKRTEGK